MIHTKTDGEGRETIDVGAYVSIRKSFLDAEASAEQLHSEASNRLRHYDTTARQSIIGAFENGMSTGNRLLDSLIRFVGIDMERIQKYLSFSENLVAAKGQELLIVWHHRKQIGFGGQGDESERGFMDVTDYVLGILSGDPLEFDSGSKAAPALSFTIPFERHVCQNYDDDSKSTRHYGSYTIHNRFSEHSPETLSQYIEDGVGSVHLYFAQEILSSGPALWMVAPHLDEARTLLNSATDAEKVAGSGI